MSLAFKRILVATDFSAPSGLAIEYAYMLARAFHAALVVIHVVEEPHPIGAELYPPEIASFRTRLVNDAKRELAAAVAGISDVDVSAEVLVGTTARRIVEAATEHDADLIVVGTRGQGPLAALLVGSVAERVVQTARCPVMTVHDTAAEDQEEWNGRRQ